MKFIYMPYERWDAMYDSMPEELVCPVVIGGNLMAIDFDGEKQKIRVVRGLESHIGLVERRMLRDDFDTSRPSVLGTGVIANQMAKELIDEGKVIPNRPAHGASDVTRFYKRRPAYPAVPVDCSPSPAEELEQQRIQQMSRHDEEFKPKKTKNRKKDVKKAKRKRR